MRRRVWESDELIEFMIFLQAKCRTRCGSAAIIGKTIAVFIEKPPGSPTTWFGQIDPIFVTHLCTVHRTPILQDADDFANLGWIGDLRNRHSDGWTVNTGAHEGLIGVARHRFRGDDEREEKEWNFHGRPVGECEP